jgi:fatty acid-binding protein DegV
VVTLSQAGTVQVAGKCLGKGKAMSQISTLMAETPPDTRFPVYGIYSSQDNNLQELEEKLAHKGQSVSAEFGIGPVIGAHIGPGAYGVVYIAKED